MAARAADDFDVIGARLRELQRERETALAGEAAAASTTNLNGHVLGYCAECQKLCVPCQGACCCG